MTAIRGLAHRSRATIMIFVLATVGTAAAAAGPTYYQAARVSILHDALSSAPYVGRGFEASQSGSLPGLLGATSGAVNTRLAAYLGPLRSAHLFAPETDSIESTVALAPYGAIPLVWRTGICAELRVHGSCPVRANQIIVSRPLTKVTGWHTGQVIRATGFPPLTIIGTYDVPNLAADYWLTRGEIYFPAGTIVSAFFTSRATLDDGSPALQGTAVVDDLLRTDRVQPAQTAALANASSGMAADPVLSAEYITVVSVVQSSVAQAQSSWHSISVPIALITAQLLALCLLLLFTAVTEAVDGRGTDIALARVRGYGRIRTLAFGLSEPVLVLLAALPAGVLAGWEAARHISGGMLRPGTPVLLPGYAWAASIAVAIAGFAAVLRAAIRALRRPVIEQWRRSGPTATNRSWVMDAVLATAAVAGLADLIESGRTSQGSHSTLGLLVPGLLGLSVAVVASRLLPIACRSGYGLTRRGGLGLYLALRHMARRPGGVRTTIVLATAFTLATYAIGAWFVGRSNESLVAAREVGAASVLTVSVPVGMDLGAVVDRADPSGQLAAPVLRYTDVTSADPVHTLLAVDPQRFGRIVASVPGFSGSAAALTAEIDPPAPPPIGIAGDAIRVVLKVDSVSMAGSPVMADLATGGTTPVQLGTLPAQGTVTLTGSTAGCPCVLEDLDIGPGMLILPPARPGLLPQRVYSPVSGSVTVVSIQVHRGGRWLPLPAGILTDGHWRTLSGGRASGGAAAGAAGLAWSFSADNQQDAILQSVNRPTEIPAVISAGVAQPGAPIVQAAGLDGSPASFKIAGVAGIMPGVTAGGAIVDIRYAELAADENYPQADQQIWLAAGAQPIVVPRLPKSVHILSVQSTASVAASLGREGPGLASILFLADAAAAVLLASGSAVLGLYISARRRRYEYAALEASGVARAALRRSLLIEIIVVSAFGSITGIAAGLAAIAIALRGVPEFVSDPGTPLNYVPSAPQLAIWLGSGVGLLLLAAGAAAIAIIRGIRSEQLRESSV